MSARPCFQALPRPVSVAGLPMGYLVLLTGVSVGGFIATLSFLWFGASAALSYVALRALAAWDPRIGDVVFTTLRRTPPTPGWFRGEGFAYHA